MCPRYNGELVNKQLVPALAEQGVWGRESRVNRLSWYWVKRAIGGRCQVSWGHPSRTWWGEGRL